ncbi:MAG: hypothetical protein R6U10_07555, partial [Thermoplasmatota archaeon]
YFEERPNGSTATLSYTVTVDSDVAASEPLVNRGNVTWTSINGSDPNERYGGWNSLDDYNATDAESVDVLSMETSKKVWNGSAWAEYYHADVGDTVTFNITVTNAGSAQLANISVNDSLPPGLMNATWGSSNIWFTAGPLSLEDEFYIEFNATVTDAGVHPNVVNITATDTENTTTVVSEDTATVEGESVGLSIEKTVWDGTAWVEHHNEDVGDDVLFNVTVTNTGTNPLVDINITDVLPAGLENASWGGASHSWLIGGPVAVGGSVSVTFYATVTSVGDLVNVANVTAACENTSAPVYAEDTAVVEGESVGLSIEKTVWDGTAWAEEHHVPIGTEVRFNLTIVNTGTNPLVDINLTDMLPAGLVYAGNATVNSAPQEPTTWGDNVSWEFAGPLGIGNSLYVEFNATVSVFGSYINRASVAGYCENTSNLMADSDEAAITSGEVSITNPKIATDVDGPPLEQGDTIRYTIWINNTGTIDSFDRAGNEFEDPIPVNMTYLNGTVTVNGMPEDDTISDGIGYDAANAMVIWNGIIPAGDSMQISFDVTIDANVSSGTVISNQGVVHYDKYGNGTIFHKPTDNPATDPQDDPTTVTLDYRPPRSWLWVTLDPDGYFVSASTFHIRADDDVGPWKIFYRIDDGPLREGDWNREVQFQINALHGYAPGPHTVEYWAVDGATNEELPHHMETYVLDTNGPDASISFDGIAEVTAGRVWQIGADTSVVLSAVDDHLGVEGIYYRVDNGNWTSYGEPFTVDEPGRHTLYYYAKDVMGNFGGMRSTVVDVGGGMPSSICTVMPGVPNGDNGWYTSGVSVELSAFDEVSGVSHVMYRVDGGAWQVYDGVFVVDSDGPHSIEYYAVDNVGNEEPVNVEQVKIDLYGPKISISRPQGRLYLFDHAILPLPGNRTVVIGPVTVAASVVDTATSGVAATELYVDDELRASSGRNVTYVLDETMLGWHTIRVVAYDNAGNSAVREVVMAVFNIAIRQP